MIETLQLAGVYEARFEADVEDDVAWVTVRIVNPTDVVVRGEVIEAGGRSVIVSAAPGETTEVHPDPPVFPIEYPPSPAYRCWAEFD